MTADRPQDDLVERWRDVIVFGRQLPRRAGRAVLFALFYVLGTFALVRSGSVGALLALYMGSVCLTLLLFGRTALRNHFYLLLGTYVVAASAAIGGLLHDRSIADGPLSLSTWGAVLVVGAASFCFVLTTTEAFFARFGRALDDQHAAKRQLQEAEEKLRHAQRLGLMGTFAGGIAHELNNALTVIIAEAALSKDEGTKERVTEAAGRAADLTRQILGFGRKDLTEPRPIRFEPVLQSALHAVERLLPKSVAMSMDIRGLEDAVVVTEASALHQVMLNLAANARDAMDGCGRWGVSAQSVDDHVVVEVTDSGPGLASEVLSRVFDPFFTTKQTGGGAGLGLANVRAIITQAGGTVHAENIAGGGARFVLTFPLSSKRPAEVQERSGSAPVCGGASLLVVDDDVRVRSALVAKLSAAGYRVEEARGGFEAIDLLARGLKVDLVCVDAFMPVVDGRSLIEWIRAHRPSIAKLLISGSTLTKGLREDVDAGRLRYLSKPFVDADLFRAVHDALIERSAVS